MRRDLLAIYLNDHVAGATFGTGLARRIAHQYRHSGRGEELARIAEEIDQDRQSLLRLMDALGVSVRGYKVYGGRLAERLSRVKPNGVLWRRSGLSTVIELETLRLGVEGKTLVWRTLLAVAPVEGGLDTSLLNELLDRARRQIDTLESLRLMAADRVFSDASRPGTVDSP